MEKVSSIRLRKDQIASIKATGQPSSVIHYAIERYRKGDIVIESEPGKNNHEGLLQIFPIYGRPNDLTDAQIRSILDAHLSTPDKKREKLIAQAQVAVQQQWALLLSKVTKGAIFE